MVGVVDESLPDGLIGDVPVTADPNQAEVRTAELVASMVAEPTTRVPS